MMFLPALLISTLSYPLFARSQQCAIGSAKEISGNWYCSEVKAISYNNFPGHGYYNRVTDMNADTGECSTETYQYSGSLSPLNEDLSVHVRGPLSLNRFAFYTINSTSTVHRKRNRDFLSHAHKHHAHRQLGHGHLHAHSPRERFRDKGEHEAGLVNRAVGDIVQISMDGRLVSWTNEYAGPASATIAPVTPATMMDLMQSHAETTTVKHDILSSKSTPLAPQSTPDSPSDDSTTAGNSWTRQSYYDADSGSVDGVTFLNHFGGTPGIPGTAAGGPAFGASLSYAASDGQSGAASPQVLNNSMIEDDVEVILMSDKSCSDGGCGYTRPGGVAYHGFRGDRKIFLFEFSMPLTSSSSFGGNMPAIWLLNGQIPRTSQYGTNPGCSCWTSGCGEFDLFEVLDGGDTRCKSTLHMAPAGGSSDWFERPISGSITAAVVFAGDSEVALIKVLDGEQNFDATLQDDVVEGWIKEKSSVFRMGT